MNLLSRFPAAHPSLRTRVAFATAIAAAIVVRHRRHDRLDRHHQRPQGTPGPQARRGGGLRDPVPAARPRPDPQVPQRPGRDHHGARPGGQVTSNSDVVLPDLPAGYADTTSTASGTGCARSRSGRSPGRRSSVAVGATYDATIADTNNLHRRVIMICSVRHRRGGGGRLAAGRIRGAAPQTARAADPCRSTWAARRPTSTSEAPPRPSRSPTPSRAWSSASGRSRTAPRPRSPRLATSPPCRRTNCAPR